MFDRLKQKLALTMLAIALLFSGSALLTPSYVLAADSKTAACEGVGLTGADCDGGKAEKKVGEVVSTVVNLLSLIVGIAAVVMVVVSGFKYVTSGGDSNRVASAKNTLIYAIVGLIIVALAQFIVRIVLEKVG